MGWDALTPLIEWAPLYDVMFGDTSRSEFLIDFCPLLYVFLLPFFNALRVLLCHGTMSGLNARPWPPALEKDPYGKRGGAGHRVVRRVFTGVKASTRFAMASSPKRGAGHV